MRWVLEPATCRGSGGAIHAAVISGSCGKPALIVKAIAGASQGRRCNVRQSDATGPPATREGADAAQDRTMAACTRAGVGPLREALPEISHFAA